MTNFDTLVKQRLEKDLQELQSLIAKHFEQRKNDDEELGDLQERIAKRKEQRAEQLRVRQEREKARLEKEKIAREEREAEEERKKLEAEERKKNQVLNVGQNYGGYLARQSKPGQGKGKVTEREKKRKLLAERRRPLNIDHLNTEKLKNKANELYKFWAVLEEEKFDFESIVNRQKYDVCSLR